MTPRDRANLLTACIWVAIAIAVLVACDAIARS